MQPPGLLGALGGAFADGARQVSEVVRVPVYYAGLLAGRNDIDLVEETGVGRDINRHYYSRAEIREEMRRPVVVRLMQLIRLRNVTSAFGGRFSRLECPGNEIVLRWEDDQSFAQLDVKLDERRATIDYSGPADSGCFRIDDEALAETI